MIDRDMVMVCALARIQADGKTLAEVSQAEMNTIIAEAIADLRLADDLNAARR